MAKLTTSEKKPMPKSGAYQAVAKAKLSPAAAAKIRAKANRMLGA